MSLSLTPAQLALLRLTMLPGVGSTISHALLEDFDNHCLLYTSDAADDSTEV